MVAAACVVDQSDKRQNPSAYAFNLTQEIKLQITKTMILKEIEGFLCGPERCECHLFAGHRDPQGLLISVQCSFAALMRSDYTRE